MNNSSETLAKGAAGGKPAAGQLKVPSMRYFRAGGFNQLSITKAEDLLLLKGLDQTLWVASSCPTEGLDLDPETLKMMDLDHDGRIRCPEVLQAIDWVFEVLTDTASLTKGADSLELTQINQGSEKGKLLYQASCRILKNLGKGSEARIYLKDTLNRSAIMSMARSNGDGIIPPNAADGEAVKQVIQNILDTIGGAKDASGSIGVTEKGVVSFFTACRDYQAWWGAAHPNGMPDSSLFVLGEETAAAFALYQELKPKIVEFFEQSKIAAYDGRALAYFNCNEKDLAALSSRDAEKAQLLLKDLPIAEVGPSSGLPLDESINPFYASAFSRFVASVVTPLLGADCDVLTVEKWHALEQRFAPYAKWLDDKKGSGVESLGLERISELLESDASADLQQLIEKDRSHGAEIQAIRDVEKLIRYHRDLFRLVNNFVALPEFYDVSRRAIFQNGTLILDGCALNLVVRVDDLKRHSSIASGSGIFLVYCEIRRMDQPKPQLIAAAVTDRNAGRITAGKNGIFYDLQGQDWDARVVKVISNPISLNEAAWAPFRRLGELFASQIEKLTASRQKAVESSLNQTFTDVDKSIAKGAAVEQKPAPVAADKGSSMGGILAGGGVAVAALSSSFAYIVNTLQKVGIIEILYGFLVIICFVFIPTIVMGMLKLRRRDLGLVLEACGWAINGRMRISLVLARQLTQVGKFPVTAKRALFQPDKDA